MDSFLTFFSDNLGKIFEQLAEHLGLTLVALVLSVLVAVPLGILISRKRNLAGAVLGFTGILQTIPSIALLGSLIPILGIGLKPALFALFIYNLLPIVRNTYTGLVGVDDAVLEAARGMGMRDRQVLWKVELPLAMPIIFAGIRTATVISVGVATLAAYIGAGGLGEFIFGGIALNNTDMILAGALPAAVLALLLDFLLSFLQKLPMRRQRKAVMATVLAIPIVFAASFLPAAVAPGTKAGFDIEFMGRPDGYPRLAARYGLEFNTTSLSNALNYKAVYEGETDVICGYSTDGRIKAFDLRILEDDQHVFPPYECAPIVREALLKEYPVLDSVLNLLSGRIADPVMTELNYRVDFLKQEPEAVARDFLDSLGLLRPDQAQGGRKVVIGSKIFSESYILAYMYAHLINGYSQLDVDLKLGLGGTKICFEALKSGELDLYPEYSGTGFQVILNPDEAVVDSLIQSPEAVFGYVGRAFSSRYSIRWMDPIGFNNTYALMVRNSWHPEIRTISQLAALEN